MWSAACIRACRVINKSRRFWWKLTYEESVQPQLFEKSNVPPEVVQAVINQGVKRSLAVQAVDDALDEELKQPG